MFRIPELLVPAGGMEQLKAAVACGADAVYAGGVSFSARARADNFSDEELKEAAAYTHFYGVKIHVALNTLLTDSELPEALEFAGKLYRYGVDAVIVQDTGLFSLLHRSLPELPLHLSTQGTVTDSSGVQAAAERGAERVILARELSLDEITEICRNKGETEIEIFVHGAICIGLSGQCHMSGMIGGRSGNRGECAQPCRMLYALENGRGKTVSEGYQLSPKDMCLLPHLEKIVHAGVDSIKVEGRMKSPEYVAAVTGIYRKHLDRIGRGLPGLPAEKMREDLRILRQMYSRGSFTDAYFRGKASSEMMSGKSPKHQGILIGTMNSYNSKNRHAQVRLTERLSVGDGVEIRGTQGTLDNIITYMKNSRGKMLKTAGPGETAEIGDLRKKGRIPEKGAEVYKLTDRALRQEMQRLIGTSPQRIPVRLRLTAAEGHPMTAAGEVQERGLTLYAEHSSEEVLETARTGAADRDKLVSKLSRTGGTPYFCQETSVEIDGKPFVQISLMNELRRKVLEDLTEQRLSLSRPSEEEALQAEQRLQTFLTAPEEITEPEQDHREDDFPVLQLYFYDTPDAEQRIREFLSAMKPEHYAGFRPLLCIPARLLRDAERSGELFVEAEKKGYLMDVVLPVEWRRTEWNGQNFIQALEILRARADKSFRAVQAADSGQVLFLKKAGIPFELDQHLNILNSEAALYWLGEGALSVCLSGEPEAFRFFSFRNIRAAERCCVQLYGRIPVMYLEHCPIGAQGAEVRHSADGSGPVSCCGAEKKYYYCKKGGWKLRDRTGAVYPVEADSSCCRAVVYSHRKIDCAGEAEELFRKGVRSFRIGIYDESPAEIQKNLRKWGNLHL